MFAGTGINITTEGKRHLGAAIGSRSYTESQTRCGSGQTRSTYWQKSPKHNLMPPIVPTLMVSPVAGPFCQEHCRSATKSIQQAGHPPCSREERDLLALPVHLGGMGIVNPASTSQHVFEASMRLTSTLVDSINAQDQTQPVDIYKVIEAKKI